MQNLKATTKISHNLEAVAVFINLLAGVIQKSKKTILFLASFSTAFKFYDHSVGPYRLKKKSTGLFNSIQKPTFRPIKKSLINITD